MKKKTLGKALSAVSIVLMFILSSTAVVNADITDSRSITIDKPILTDKEQSIVDSAIIADEEKPVISDAKLKLDLFSNSENNLNMIVSEPLQNFYLKSQNNQEKYAIIMVGRYFGAWHWSYLLNMTVFLDIVQQYYTWYLNDAAEMYKTLHDVYGYDDSNIFLLVKTLPDVTYGGKQYFTMPGSYNNDWNDYDDISGNSLEVKLQNVLNTFKPGGENELNATDQLFICFIDHGGNEQDNYVRGIWDDDNGYLYDFIAPNDNENTNWLFEDKSRDYASGIHGEYITYNTQTYAVYSRLTQEHSDDLVLKTNTLKNVKGFRINARKDDALYKMDIKFYNGNNPNPVKIVSLDTWPDHGYKYVEFENETIQSDKVEISFYENDPLFGFAVHKAKVYDFNFWEADKCCGEVGYTYYGCPFNSIPTALIYLFGVDTEKLYDGEFDDYLLGIESKMIFALQPCMSGGFIREISIPSVSGQRIICTSSRGCEPAYASWIGCFRNALKKYDGDNNGIPDADYNNDTKISILEAYRYAAGKVEEQINSDPTLPSQHPLIDDNSDGIGHHFYESNYYGNIIGKDGYIADQTFL